jgi:hypothetical protein
LAAASGCGDAESTSRLRVEHTDDGDLVRVTADWNYWSSEVDVDLTLETEYPEGGCVTTARLWVNKATETADTYRLDPTDCSVLSLTEGGDIVLHESPTGHDWSTEELFVDTDRERLELGPWTSPDGVSYRFSLESPPCSNDCECPELTRRAGAQASSLDLGRTCD